MSLLNSNRLFVASLSLALLPVAACGDDASEPAASADAAVQGDVGGDAGGGQAEGADGPTWWQDAGPIVKARCGVCHTDGGVAPFPLTTYDEAAPLAAALRASIESGTMPPWQAAPGVRDYRFDLSLSDDERDTLMAWFDAGAPEGDASNPAPELETNLSDMERVDVELAMDEPYTPPANADDYRCFIVEWPLDEFAYITGTSGLPGETTISHHTAMYLVGPDDVERFRALDDEDEGIGYECFGAAAGDDYFAPYELVGGWAPGAEGLSFPAGTGVPVEPGSVIILQQHYNTVAAEPKPDLSRMLFSVASEVEREAHFVPFLDWAWVLTGMPIAAGEAEVAHTYQNTMDSALDAFFPTLDTSAGLEIHAISPHMHLLGRDVRLEIVRDSGEEEMLLHLPFWDFDWQRVYWFDQGAYVGPDDELRVRCQWDNSAANQPIVDGQALEPRDVDWGDGSYDEMCVSVLYVTSPAP